MIVYTLSYFFSKLISGQDIADVGVEIIPSYFLHKKMSIGVSYGEQLIFDIKRLERNFPSLPIKLILIEI